MKGRPHFSAEDFMNKIQAMTLILGAVAAAAAQSATTSTRSLPGPYADTITVTVSY
jgi:hypothetical protein